MKTVILGPRKSWLFYLIVQFQPLGDLLITQKQLLLMKKEGNINYLKIKLKKFLIGFQRGLSKLNPPDRGEVTEKA